MKFFVTKWVLTRGIQEWEGRKSEFHYDAVVSPSLGGVYKPDWHETREEAVARANALRDEKIKALRKAADSLEKLRFE
jgi:hypothetical protein